VNYRVTEDPQEVKSNTTGCAQRVRSRYGCRAAGGRASVASATMRIQSPTVCASQLPSNIHYWYCLPYSCCFIAFGPFRALPIGCLLPAVIVTYVDNVYIIIFFVSTVTRTRTQQRIA